MPLSCGSNALFTEFISNHVRQFANVPQLWFDIGVRSPHKPLYYDLPHNPYWRAPVAGERYWTPTPPHKVDLGDLDDRRESGITQLVTFRLTDSFPKSLQSEWGHLLKIEDERKRRTQLEMYLDKGRGE